ncbi:progonadoliberin-1-like [Megalops cyprinoides]|uniref:progonadoliberin-1-like n=1 Tax=Megalops cyprinoides TaxID=118141 RepID=UPI0018655EB2|nr:progonadoliberin-1-like [Megalops cyprinoides]
MAHTSSLLWLGLAVALVCQGCCQHWSYGLRPGGKRAADSLSLQDTLQEIAEELQKLDASSLSSCADLSPQITISSLKEILANLADTETGRKNI